MKIYEPIGGDSLIDEVNEICGSTNESYANRKKIKNFNEALDYYWFLAVNSAVDGTFDDTGRSNAPIETQNLVSGTNAYKVSSFTNEVLNIVKLTALDADAVEHDLIYEDFEDITDFTQTYSTSITGVPTHWTKLGDYIYINATPDYNETSGLRAYVDRELSRLAWVTFTVTIATPGVVTATGHGLVDGDAVLLVTDGALPTGLTAESTIYYVDQQTSDTFRLCTTPSNVGATYITTSGTQSGTHKYVKVSGEPGIPSIHHNYLAKFAADKFIDTKHPKFQKNRADKMLCEETIKDYWQSTIKEGKTIIETNGRSYK